MERVLLRRHSNTGPAEGARVIRKELQAEEILGDEVRTNDRREVPCDALPPLRPRGGGARLKVKEVKRSELVVQRPSRRPLEPRLLVHCEITWIDTRVEREKYDWCVGTTEERLRH
jgi:hypothetical protein